VEVGHRHAPKIRAREKTPLLGDEVSGLIVLLLLPDIKVNL
jgi:hypothetical protein